MFSLFPGNMNSPSAPPHSQTTPSGKGLGDSTVDCHLNEIEDTCILWSGFSGLCFLKETLKPAQTTREAHFTGQ